MLKLIMAAAVLATSVPAPVPPMGWNSWDAYGTTVNEAQVKANADAMAAGLAQFGWKYVVVDIQWYAPTAAGHDYQPGASLTLDEYGRLTPALNRFPSAVNGRGFGPLADYVHGKGLKFGIHIMRGIPRQAVDANLPILGSSHRAAEVADKQNGCQWNPDMWGVDVQRPGGQEYYDSIAQLYASWGVDFIKADDMGSHRFQPAEIEALSRALARTGRPVVLSLSPGPAPRDQAAFFAAQAQMWRISDDFWDDWRLLRKQFDLTRDWAPVVGAADTWPDADMLPVGLLRVTAVEGGGAPSKFTHDEQRTLLTLWSIFRSPLIIGGDLPTLDPFARSLLTNPEVIAVNQGGTGARESFRDSRLIAWTASPGGAIGAVGAADARGKYTVRCLAVFNVSDAALVSDKSWQSLGIEMTSPAVRDLWERRDLGVRRGLHISLSPHASALYQLTSIRNN